MTESRGAFPNDGPAIPLLVLERVPILPRYVALMQYLLLAHGSTLIETGEPLPTHVDPAARMYTVTFPPGTIRVNRMRITRTVVFAIQFPDGYRLQGARLYPITIRKDDCFIHGLFPAQAEIQPEAGSRLTRPPGHTTHKGEEA